ncbi:F-box protein 21 [Homalodisca vitripennis]|nr:F-box protein 21 [Homalodisca vitripennis]
MAPPKIRVPPAISAGFGADVIERKTSLEIVPIGKISNSRGADQKYKLNCNGKAIMYRANHVMPRGRKKCMKWLTSVLFWQVVERMANNLEIAGRQRTDMNGRSVRLRSALELILMVNPSNMYCLLQLARLYMQFNMDVSRLQAAFSTITHVSSPVN